ncbi:GmrSD restriction endonuclease domain-containing protein, partial [Morganella morganii]
SNTLKLENFIGSVSYGERDFNIEFSDERKSIFEKYTNSDKNLNDAIEDVENIEGMSDSDRRIIDAIKSIEDALDPTIKEKISFFIDYLMEKVYLIDISVSSESEAHRVFVTMNDRGLRLGAIELLKGYILSRITSSEDSQECHEEWVKTMSLLRNKDPEGDSLFIRTLLRAKWANSIRGKSKGDDPGDFDKINDAYHRWFDDNTTKLNLNNSDDFYNFAKKDIPKYADLYLQIINAEEIFNAEYPDVYYNGIRKFSFQSMIILSALQLSDTREIIRKKIQLISKFIDLILTSRIITKKANTYDNLKDISFNLAKDVRGKEYPDLLAYIKNEWVKYYPAIDKLTEMTYENKTRSEMLYILSRIASYMENKINLTNKVGFDVYMQRDKGMKTFDIEHILRSVLNDTEETSSSLGFTNDAEYNLRRNLIGALILLPRSRNRSLKDNIYTEKRTAYSGENILCQSLCANFYQNNPELDRFLAENPNIQLQEHSQFTSSSITERGDFYKAIALDIWSCPS